MDEHTDSLAPNAAAAAKDRVAQRSAPRQERSRARQLALLAAAEAIVVEVGVDGLKMRELARRANLPIASVYHYYPSAAAIIHGLARQYFDTMRAALDASLRRHLPESVQAPSPRAALPHIIDDMLAVFLSQAPAVRFIRTGLRANHDLRLLDIEDTFVNATYLEPYLRRLIPGLETAHLKMTAAVLLEAISVNLLLAMELPEAERAGLIEALKKTVVAMFEGFRAAH
jgi:AcrR family transcriptional regulator